jgi:hypothetical protein
MAEERPRILITNDDGYHSDGIEALEAAMKLIGEVYVVAPATEQSGASHSLTLSRPLRIRQIDERHWTVDGTPTDCVTFALNRILPADLPVRACLRLRDAAAPAEEKNSEPHRSPGSARATASSSGTPAASLRTPGSRVQEQQSRLWGTLCHLSALAGFFMPFGNVIGPLIVWLIKKDEFPFVNDQGKESLNFQISMSIYMLAAGASILFLIGFVLLPIVVLVDVIFTIVASIQANTGQPYRYPMTIRFIT